MATVTIEPNGNPLVWDRPGDLDAAAVYLSRLVVARKFADLKIGSALLNWACAHAWQRHRAELVRIDVWTRNFALHEYYRAQGFRWQGYCSDPIYPSRARFQRSTSKKRRFAPRILGPFDTRTGNYPLRSGLSGGRGRGCPGRMSLRGRATSC